MNAVQIALHCSTTFAVAAPWSCVVRRHPAHGRALLPFRLLSSATMPATVSPSPRCPMLRPLCSSLSISGSHTAFPSHATSPFAASFRHLSVAHLKHGTRPSVFEQQAFLSTSSRVIRSTSIYHPAPSDHQMGASPMNPQTPNQALQRTAPGCHACCCAPPTPTATYRPRSRPASPPQSLSLEALGAATRFL